MSWRRIARYILAGAAAATASAAAAQGFAGFVSPPRFELKAKPGDLIREVVEIGNGDDAPASYDLRTADWELDPDGGLIVQERLRAGSCRPWTALERKSIKLAPHGLKRYRFEIRVPEDVPAAECRLAILIESSPGGEATARAGALQFPVSGRIAVIIYLAVGGAAPALKIESLKFGKYSGVVQPLLSLRNTGTAHGRPQGLLEALDGAGKKLNLLVSTLPVLPGERRTVPLYVKNQDGSDFEGTVQRPLKIKGTIEWEGGSEKVDTTIQ